MIRHIVVFSVKDGLEQELERLVSDIRALPAEIDEIRALACGPPLNSTDFDCALTVDVADDAALQAYRDHPAHQPVLQTLRDIGAAVVVADISLSP